MLERQAKSRQWWQPFTLGVIAAAVGSLVGVGGGILLVPILTMWGLGQKRAQGTSLLVIVARHPLVIFMYAILGNIDYAFAIPLAIGGIAGAFIGASATRKYSNQSLARAFGVLLLVISVAMIVFPEFSSTNLLDIKTVLGFFAVILFGVAAGFMAGFFGVGGGMIFVPAGTLFGGLEQVVSQGTGYLSGFPTILTGFLKYRGRGEWDWELARWLIPGAWVGTVAGSWSADLIPGDILRWLFAGFIFYLGLRQLIVRTSPNHAWKSVERGN